MHLFGNFGPLVGAVDAGTSSVKFLVFAANTSEVLTYHQINVKRFSPKEGWVEQDPLELIKAVFECIEVTVDNLVKLDINPKDIVGIGVTNQRETTIIWNSATGEPLYSAIVWLDTRTSKVIDDLCKSRSLPHINAVVQTSGLPLSTYFSAVKLRWLLNNVPACTDALHGGICMAGTLDSWLIWNLTGGCNGGTHVTDVTNASRTQLMSLTTLQWDKKLLRFFEIPPQVLPKIKSSSEIYGYITVGSLSGIPIAGCIGDQQGSLIGQNCMKFGQAKCTYSTGCFLLYNTGDTIIHSSNGLLTTVAYKLGPDAPPVYALEGSIAAAGDTLEWLRDGVGISENLSDKEMQLVTSDPRDNVYFVPAFSGLFSPYWRKDARGVMCGLTGSTQRWQVVRGAYEAVCQQVRAAAEALANDWEPLQRLLADGPLAHDAALMQMQADVIGMPVVRPLTSESAALGAAILAGRALSVWPASTPVPPADLFLPSITDEERELRKARWEEALERCKNWATDDKNNSAVKKTDEVDKKIAVLPSGLFFLGTALIIMIADKLKSI